MGSRSTRSGCLTHEPYANRTSSRGSSVRTVPAPVSTAPLRARHPCTSARAASPLIHACPPDAGAVRASRLIANFSRMKGRRELVLPSLPYIAVYRVKEQVVEISRIYHGAQDWP